MIKVKTQAALNGALAKNPNAELTLTSGSFSVRVEASASPLFVVEAGVELRVEAWGSSQPRVEARGSSQPHVVAWESSQPRVVAWESSQPRVEAWESSQPRVEAWESSQPRVEAWGYVQLSLLGRVIAKISAKVSVLIEGSAEVQGGQQTRVSRSTAEEWCDYYGVAVKDGIATLYKALDENFVSPHGISYAPGAMPVAEDWDGGARECGGGLHFSPTPAMARAFNAKAKRFCACPVRLAGIAVHSDGGYPEKVKARGVCAPCYEVDEDGERISVPDPESAAKDAA